MNNEKEPNSHDDSIDNDRPPEWGEEYNDWGDYSDHTDTNSHSDHSDITPPDSEL